MYASKVSDDNLYNSYINPTVYEYSQNAAFRSLEPDSPRPSSPALPDHTPPIPHTIAQNASHIYPTDFNRYVYEPRPVYLSEQVSFETELRAIFGDRHVEERAAEDDVLLPHQSFVLDDMECDICPFPKSEMFGGTCYGREILANSMDQFDESTTLCNSPSKTSISEADSVYIENASLCGRPTNSSGMRSQGSGHSHTSSSSLAMSDLRTICTPSSASEQDCHSPHFCHICNSSFTLSKDLKRHISSIHDQERWPCPDPRCRQVFSRSDKLLQHRRTHQEAHTIKEEHSTHGQPSFVSRGSQGADISSIPIKEAEAGSNWRLLDDEEHNLTTPHNHSVSSKKSLDCPFCNKKFTLQHDRLRHLRTLHRKQKHTGYRCAVPGCPKGDKIFNRLDNFKKHLENKHEDERSKDIISKSKTLSGETFTVVTPEMYLSR